MKTSIYTSWFTNHILPEDPVIGLVLKEVKVPYPSSLLKNKCKEFEGEPNLQTLDGCGKTNKKMAHGYLIRKNCQRQDCVAARK